MRKMFCDRCNRQGAEKKLNVEGVRVVRMTLAPWDRTLDLCGDCRRALMDRLDVFLEELRLAAQIEWDLSKGDE